MPIKYIQLPDNIKSRGKRINVSLDMAAAVAAAIQSPRKQSSAISVGHQRATGVKNAILHIRRKSFAFEHRVTTASSPYSGGRCCIVAASNSPNEEANSNADDPDLSFTSQVRILSKISLICLHQTCYSTNSWYLENLASVA